jgi:glutamate formiminotransferase/formiminotetrahydrofolate cyclodeaminase
MSDRLVALSLTDFVHRVSDRNPLPGSGCVAAAVGALGAALAIMVVRSGPYEREEGLLTGLRDDLLGCVDRDAEAYEAFIAARRARRPVEDVLEGAIRVPAEIAELSLSALERLASSVHGIRPALSCECWTAALALGAAVEGAARTARANLPQDAEGRRVEELEARCDRARELLADVRRALGARA